MFKQDQTIVADALSEHWDIPGPLTMTESLARGVTADVWLVEDGAGCRYVAKFAYDSQPYVEAGLSIAEHVETSTGLLTGRPVRDRAGNLTVMLPSVPGEKHPLALLTHVEGTCRWIWQGTGAAELWRVLWTHRTAWLLTSPLGSMTGSLISWSGIRWARSWDCVWRSCVRAWSAV